MTFILASPQGQSVGVVEERAVAAAQAWSLGALVLIDANGAFAECGASPALIFGVAESDYGADTSGFNILGTKGFPVGRMQATKAKGRLFSAEYEGSLPPADGAVYNVIRSADGKWRVNFALTAAPRVALIGRQTPFGLGAQTPADTPAAAAPKRVYVRFLDANCQDL